MGIEDKQYEDNGAKFYSSSKEIINNSNLILKVNCPTDEETKMLKEKTILVGIFNPSNNQDKLKEVIKKTLVLGRFLVIAAVGFPTLHIKT